jgi:hypothetical protein
MNNCSPSYRRGAPRSLHIRHEPHGGRKQHNKREQYGGLEYTPCHNHLPGHKQHSKHTRIGKCQPRACGSVGAIQPPAATYPKTPRDNLRTLELRSNIEAIGTAPGPPALQTPLCGSNIVALWKSCYKQQEDQIQALTQESNATTTIHTRDTRFLVFSTH